MISYFPPPLPDETFYSMLCRYALHVDEPSSFLVNENLFGKSKVCVSYEFPVRINDFLKHVSHLSRLNSDSIIENHSLFNFYKHFIKPLQAEVVRKKMLSSDKGNINGTVGLNGSDLKPFSSPRYCIKCAENDFSILSQTYWHRVHHLPISVCPIHKCYLNDLKVPILSLRSQQYYHAVTINNLETNLNMCSNQLILDSANFATDLLFNRTKIGVSKDFYREFLSQSGFYVGKKLLHDKFIKSVIDVFGKTELEEWSSFSHTKLTFKDLMVSMIYKGENIFNPARHILLNLFIGRFSKVSSQYDVLLSKGPWLCYNKCSDHYLQSIIPEYSVRYLPSLKQNVTFFKCSCGMVYKQYQRTYKKSKKDIIKIVDYGDKWISNFNASYEKGISVYHLAKEFGVSVSVVKVKVKKLSKGKVEHSISDSREDVRDKFREMWSRMLMDGKSPTKARTILQHVYYWLNTYDKTWLKNINITYGRRSKNRQMKINWQEIDKYTLGHLKTAHESLLVSDQSKRITKTLLLRMISQYKYLTSKRHLIKLPESKSFIENNVEPENDYQLRRIEIAYSKVDGEKTYSKVVRSSGLKKLLPSSEIRLRELLQSRP